VRPYTPIRYLICGGLAAALVLLCLTVVHVNTTTVALSMLLLVLGVATHWGLREGVLTSLLCMFAFNFFFLPPVGTLTIADPQNWVALTAFLVSAVVASQLSARAKSRAEEALARRAELERLYQLSRAMLMDDETDLNRSTLTPVRDIFHLTQVAFYDAELGQTYPEDPTPLRIDRLAQSAQLIADTADGSAVYIPVRLGARVVGSLGLAGANLTRPEQDSIANLVAIGYERIRALRRAAEAEAARQGERLKTFVLDGIAHDLKTPLTAIKTCVTTLITIPPQSEEKRSELLSIIDEESERLHKTISEAIQLARIESSKVTLQRREFHLQEFIEQLLDSCDRRERLHGSVPATLTVTADAALLQQALRHVIDNAMKYSPSSTIVEIEAALSADGAVIRVLDDGRGINPREIERIFDKFYRGSRGRDDSAGTGMGLAIARGIIEAHGGRIWAENRPGGGAVFAIQLPSA
jgi:two-component system, OmpR family, sensor histidine kinase KdpD